LKFENFEILKLENFKLGILKPGILKLGILKLLSFETFHFLQVLYFDRFLF